MKAFLFVLFSSCILLSACKKDSIQISKDKLVGTWREVSPLINTAQNRSVLTFNADNTMIDSLEGTGVNHYSFINQDSMHIEYAGGYSKRVRFSFQANNTQLVFHQYFHDFTLTHFYDVVYQKD